MRLYPEETDKVARAAAFRELQGPRNEEDWSNDRIARDSQTGKHMASSDSTVGDESEDDIKWTRRIVEIAADAAEETAKRATKLARAKDKKEKVAHDYVFKRLRQLVQ